MIVTVKHKNGQVRTYTHVFEVEVTKPISECEVGDIGDLVVRHGNCVEVVHHALIDSVSVREC